MAEENNKIQEQTVEGTKTEEAGEVDNTQTTENKTEGAEIDVKAEAQKIADIMVAKKLKGMPSKEELKAFKEWQETQKTAEQKQAEKETEYQKALAEKEEVIKENQAFKSGVNSDDVEYVVFKVSKMDGDFEENLKDFLKENPKYLEKKQDEQETKTKDTGVASKGVATNEESGVMSILKQKYPEIYK